MIQTRSLSGDQKCRSRARAWAYTSPVSDLPQGEGWWQASDGKWYPPHLHPSVTPPPPPPVRSSPPWSSPVPGSPYGYGAAPGYAPPGYGYGPFGPVDSLGRPLATWGQRVGALLLDSLILAIPSIVIAFIILASATSSCSSVGYSEMCHSFSSDNLIVIVLNLAWFVYFPILDGRSQSLGKRAVGIAVRDSVTGQPIGFWKALGRWFIYAMLWYLLFIPGLLNALSPLWDARRQAWHDKAVGSLVVRLR